MDKFDRIFKLHSLLSEARYPVPRVRLMDGMECSRATLTRIIRSMRLYLGAPIEYDREHNGYYYDHRGEHSYELPGLWFNASELYALLVSHRLLSEAQPGLLDPYIAPLTGRIEEILSNERLASGDVDERVRILATGARKPAARSFASVANAIMQRRRLDIVYHGRERDEVTRSVSPQRLTHHRDNWYLDAWCHTKRGLRSFSLDRIREARSQPQSAREISHRRLEEHLGTAYGIFRGKPRHTAVLRFTPQRARWVADETWHPRQAGLLLEDGSYELRVPYNDPRELVMDVLKYGPDVEVLGPDSLRAEVVKRLHQSIRRYAQTPSKSTPDSKPSAAAAEPVTG